MAMLNNQMVTPISLGFMVGIFIVYSTLLWLIHYNLFYNWGDTTFYSWTYSCGDEQLLKG